MDMGLPDLGALRNGHQEEPTTVLLNGQPVPLPLATFAMLADIRDLLIQIRDAVSDTEVPT